MCLDISVFWISLFWAVISLLIGFIIGYKIGENDGRE
jgi:uncharacterized protein YneF (UPF0154 family)